MQEQQGNLMPQLSGLPGPRPFNKGKNKMENENKSSNPMHADGKPDMSKPVTDSVDEIVAKAAAALGAGKAFGGWTDAVEEGNNSPLVKTGPDSSRPDRDQQYTKTIRPSDIANTMSKVRNIANRTMNSVKKNK